MYNEDYRTKPLITIIVPVYNASETLNRCVSSILNQTYTKLQIILINDGSTDESAFICDKLSNEDNRIEVIHKDNEGVSIARNMGLKRSKGNYLRFVDSDDYLELDAIENSVRILNKYKYDIIFEGISRFRNTGGTRQVSISSKEMKTPDYEIYQIVYNLMVDGLFGYTCNKMMRLDIIKENNIIFKKEMTIYEDLVFVLEYVEKSNYIYVTQYINYNYYVHENSLANLYRKERLLFAEIARNKMNNLLDKFNIDTDKKQLLVLNFVFSAVKEYLISSITPSILTNYMRIKEVYKYDIFLKDLNLSKGNTGHFSFTDKLLLKLIKYKRTILIFVLLKLYTIKRRVNVLWS